MLRIPKIYKPVYFRNITPVDNDGYIGIGLSHGDKQVLRFKIHISELASICSSALTIQYDFHSVTSIGIPSSDVSSNSCEIGCNTEKVAFNAKSSAACDADT